MKLVVLDAEPAFGCRAVDGSSWLSPISDDPLRALGEVQAFASTSPDQVLARCQHAEVVLSNKVVLGEEHFRQLPELRLVNVLATGVNIIDLEAARRHAITVCNVPGYSTASTAQHAFALILELCNQVGMHNQSVHAGQWCAAESFSYFRAPLLELDGLTMGVFGLGAIGRRVAQIAATFGMRVIATTRTRKDVPGVELVSWRQMLAESDILSLHCPLTQKTKHLINEQSLALMKPSAMLINCARGAVVDAAALAQALHRGALRAAAVDVLDTEPALPENPLLSAPHCIITPHIAWASEAARQRLVTISANNVRAFAAGTPQNVVAAPD